jgi:hypothetical protein
VEARRRGLEQRDPPAAAALLDRDERVHRVQVRIEVVRAGRDHAGMRQQDGDPGGHLAHGPDHGDVGRCLVAGEDLAEVRGDGQPPTVVRAVEADDVRVVGEPGRDGRSAAPVPPVDERGVERPDLGVVRVGRGHAV